MAGTTYKPKNSDPALAKQPIYYSKLYLGPNARLLGKHQVTT